MKVLKASSCSLEEFNIILVRKLQLTGSKEPLPGLESSGVFLHRSYVFYLYSPGLRTCVKDK